MKRIQIFVVMFLVVSFAMGRDTIKIYVPPFTKYLRVTGEQVNLRKSPTTQSAKLQEWASDAGSSETQYYPFYSGEKGLEFNRNQVGSYVSSAHFETGTITPIVEESGDWCKVIYSPYPESNYIYHRTREAYIMSKFGQKIDVATNMTLSDFGYTGMSYRDGKYSVIGLTITPGEDKDYNNLDEFGEPKVIEGLDLHFAILIDNTYLWTKVCKLKIQKLNKGKQPRIYWTKEEYDDGFVAGTNTISTICLPNIVNIKNAANSALQYILTMPDDEFIKLVTEGGRMDYFDQIYSSGVLYFKSTNGVFFDVKSAYYEDGRVKMVDKSLIF